MKRVVHSGLSRANIVLHSGAVLCASAARVQALQTPCCKSASASAASAVLAPLEHRAQALVADLIKGNARRSKLIFDTQYPHALHPSPRPSDPGPGPGPGPGSAHGPISIIDNSKEAHRVQFFGPGSGDRGPAARCAIIQAKKPKYLLVLKEVMRAAPRFFGVRWHVGMALVNNICARKCSRREVGGPGQHLRAGVGERKAWVNGGMISDSRSLLSAPVSA
jgi:hypothetical protein